MTKLQNLFLENLNQNLNSPKSQNLSGLIMFIFVNNNSSLVYYFTLGSDNNKKERKFKLIYGYVIK